MTFSSVPSAMADNLTLAELRQMLQRDMVACRQSTLNLVNHLTEAEFCQQAHPQFSPVGWHLGHIAFTEALWLLENLKQEPCAFPQYRQLFAADGLPKAERQNLPDLPEILHFMAAVRDRTFAYLKTAPLYDQLRLWRWVLQHESQHAETATYLLTLHRWETHTDNAIAVSGLQSGEQAIPVTGSTDNMMLVPGGTFEMGSDSVDALDNERPIHEVAVADFWIDQHPVMVAEYRQFIVAGGYQTSQWWHPQGWTWVQQAGITQPLYWRDEEAWQNTPVCGVSWFEADAYACFVGKRLPTEAEWERAARWHPTENRLMTYPWGDAPLTFSQGNCGGQGDCPTPVNSYPAGPSAMGCNDLLGNVWEWTQTWFEAYPGFTAYPYTGYSQVYFDQAHRVLRGGSWATRPWVLRPTFRNWYQPDVREIFAGFRCALTHKGS